ncbi:molybdopterin-binding protein, partial [bacterium]|nr:molybdopterin-binding protein [bacterium]
DAANELAPLISGNNIEYGKPSEGKITFKASVDGFAVISRDIVSAINNIDQLALTTRHSLVPVKKGDTLAGFRIIPLVIDKDKIGAAKKILNGITPPLEVKIFKNKKVGAVITGSEVYNGRIKDAFSDIIKNKIEDYGSTFLGKEICPDDKDTIIASLNKFKDRGCDVIFVTGGMSVDPDDITKNAIQDAGAKVISHGAPVLPGNMFLIANWDNTVVLGIPACAIFFERTILDLFLPRVLADVRVEKSDISSLGYGGLCLNCKPCHYPNCSFGKV